jgi:outer membrane protein OmpA-like peptidoglycan-associated protein
VVVGWTSYKVFNFNGNDATLNESDMRRVAQIADYMKKNPSLHVGIDGHLNPNNSDLSNNRVNVIRDSLMKAGMPSSQIEIGAFGDPQLRREGRVEVMLRTGR